MGWLAERDTDVLDAGRAQDHGRRDVYGPAQPAEDPLGPWKTLNAMLAENPPPPHHALVLSQFAGAREPGGLRAKITKGPGSRAAGLAMAFKLIESAQDRWRAENAPHLVALTVKCPRSPFELAKLPVEERVAALVPLDLARLVKTIAHHQARPFSSRSPANWAM